MWRVAVFSYSHDSRFICSNIYEHTVLLGERVRKVTYRALEIPTRFRSRFRDPLHTLEHIPPSAAFGLCPSIYAGNNDRGRGWRWGGGENMGCAEPPLKDDVGTRVYT
jgi:hypothetical protein